MATEKIIFDTEIKVNKSTDSVKSVKAELRALNNELARLEPGSEAFVKAAKRAGQLKDTIGDVKNTINAFNPEAKFQALAGAIGIAANGFSVLQGSMALFGSENEDLNKVIAKTQGAIALATGLNGLLGMKDAFVLLGTQVRTLIPALNSMSAAMLGALTGGVAVAIVLIISYWKELKALVTGTTEEVKLTTEETTAAIQKGHEEFKKAADSRIAISEREAKLKLKGRALDEQLAKLERDRKITEAIASGKLADEKLLIEQEYLKALADIKDKYAKEQEQKDKERKAKEDAERKAKYNKDFQDIKDAQSLKNAEQEKIATDIDAEREKQNERDKSELERSRALAAQQVQVKQEQVAAEKALDEQAIEAKKQLLATSSNILGSLSQLAGQQTAEGKALAIAQATIDTYLSASSAYAAAAKIDPFVLAPLAAGAAILAGFARVKSIAEVQVPGGKGSSGGGISGASAPPIPRIPQNVNGTKLNGNNEVFTRSLDEQQKVIVTETDITSTQNRVKKIIKKATIK